MGVFAMSFGAGFFLGSAILGAFELSKVAVCCIVLVARTIVLGLTWVLARVASKDYKSKRESEE
jgi:hypothetical protein